jgi:hypothetical protein
MPDSITLQFSASANDYGTVEHKQLAFLAMAEALLTWRPVIDHLATLRKGKGFAHARAHGRAVAWCQQESSRFVRDLFSLDVPSLAKLLAPCIARDPARINLTATRPNSEPPTLPPLDGLSVKEKRQCTREHKAALKVYEAQAPKLGRRLRRESYPAYLRYARWYIQHVVAHASIKRLVEDEIYPDGYEPSGRRDVQRGIDRITDLLSLPPRPNRSK